MIASTGARGRWSGHYLWLHAAVALSNKVESHAFCEYSHAYIYIRDISNTNIEVTAGEEIQARFVDTSQERSVHFQSDI